MTSPKGADQFLQSIKDGAEGAQLAKENEVKLALKANKKKNEHVIPNKVFGAENCM